MTDLRAQAIQRFKDAFPDLTDAADVTIEDLRRRDDDLWNSFVPADIIVEPIDTGLPRCGSVSQKAAMTVPLSGTTAADT